MSRVNPEQLEAEADAILREEGLLPPDPDHPDGDDKVKDTAKATPAPDDELDPPDDDGKGKLEDEVATDDDDGKKPPKPGKAEDTDDLAGLTIENAQERIRNAQARMTRATQEAAELRRASATQAGRLKELEAEVEKLKAGPPEPDDPDTDPSKKSYASLEALRDDYPTLVNPLLDAIEDLNGRIKALGGQVDEVRTQAATSEADRTAQAERDKRAAHDAAILKAHSDAFELFETDQFQGWLERKPIFQRVAREGTAAEIVEMFDAYKKAVGIEKKRKEKDRAAREGETPPPRKVPVNPSNGAPTFTRAQIKAMSDEQYAANEAAIDEAMAAGRITD